MTGQENSANKSEDSCVETERVRTNIGTNLEPAATVDVDKEQDTVHLRAVFTDLEEGESLFAASDIIQLIEKLEQEELEEHGHKRKVQEHAFERLKSEFEDLRAND